MIWWDEEFLKRCRQLRIEIEMYIRYVDDANSAVVPLEAGTRYENGRLVHKPEHVEEDKRIEKDKFTAEILRKIANEIISMIQMEEDVCSNYPDKRLPILDLKVWIEKIEGNMNILHEFYKKPMATRSTLKATTAYPNSQVRAIMVEEVLRRLRNCHPEMSWSERGKHLTKFANEMKHSGHKEHFRQIVFEKAVCKFVHQLTDHLEGKKDIYRTRERREQETMKKGGRNNRDSWYKKKDSKNKNQSNIAPTSVLRVPFTNNSELKKRTQKSLETMKAPHGTKTLVIEGGGMKLRNLLVKPDPFAKDNCDREDCNLKNCKERCYQAHVNYNILCKNCETNNEETKYVYMGESSRGCYNRSKQHRDAYRNEQGFMWDHCISEHGGDHTIEFEMELIAQDSDPMRRIIRESVRIRNARRAAGSGEKDDKGRVMRLMNRKHEWFGIKTIEVNFEQE